MLPTICGSAQLERLRSAVEMTNSLQGEIWECGVYRGGSANEIFNVAKSPFVLRLFDTFEGLPIKGNADLHLRGRFNVAQTEYQNILDRFKEHPNVFIHRGWIPETFSGLEKSIIRLAHIDVDSGEAYTACLDFIWPRLVQNGIVVFDDYGAAACDNATLVVDVFAKQYGLTINKTTGWGAWIQKNN